MFVTNVGPAVAVNLEWTRQLGTSAREDNHGVSADGVGNVYISGYTQGSLQGTNVGARDAFLAKYDSAGSRLWIKQLGSSVDDRGWGVSADGVGNVYLAGTTGGSLQGANLGSTDAFLTKYDAAGALLWTRQLGTTVDDDGRNVYTDSAGNVYISGFTSGSLQGSNAGFTDAFVSKYNSVGALQWTRQLGTTTSDYSYGVTADTSGNVFISGTTSGRFQGSGPINEDAFVAKYNSAGVLQWTQQLGTTTTADRNFTIAADTFGNIFISGVTNGSLQGTNAGGFDAFVAKYDSTGARLWTRQLGTSTDEDCHSVTTDNLGNVYISGVTQGSLDGMNAGGQDAFVAKYDAAGTLQWLRQQGSSAADISLAISADRLGSVYISGMTIGNMGGTNAGNYDVFIAKYSDVPPLVGDYDNDGAIDADDYQVWRQAFGASGNQFAADGNKDGVVNAADYVVWRQRYGVPAISSLAAIPEPSPVILMVLGVVAALKSRF
jgi:Beta-propeller repeat